MLRIIGIYARLNTVDSLSARTRHVPTPVFIRKKRGGFSHTVSHRIVKLYLLEAFLDLRIERGSAHDITAHLSAKRGVKTASDLIEYYPAHSRDSCKNLHVPFAKYRHDGRLVHLFHHKRNRTYKERMNVVHGFQQQGWCRSLSEEIYRTPAGERIKELIHHSVDMRHRQH